MKILIIPDVHGRSFWKKAILSGKYDKIVFLGDYVDPYELESVTNTMAIVNFKEILSLKACHPKKVILLLGNHDLSYLSDHYRIIAASDRYDYEHQEVLKSMYCDNKRFFKLAYEERIGSTKYLFSHAGVTQSWLGLNKKVIIEPDVAHLNHLLKTKKGIETLTQVGKVRYGDYPSGSIVWADSSELAESEPIPNIYQIVGHTMQYDNPLITDKFACLDCRAAFSLDEEGGIKPVTEITPYDECIYYL